MTINVRVMNTDEGSDDIRIKSVVRGVRESDDFVKESRVLKAGESMDFWVDVKTYIEIGKH